jgi:hypothetical protein
MKRTLFALLMLGSLAGAQSFPPDSGGAGGGGSYDGGSVTNPFLAPDGSAAAPGFAFTNDTDSGLHLTGGEVYFSFAGTNRIRFRAAQINLLEDLFPETGGTYNLGFSTLDWLSVHADEFNTDGDVVFDTPLGQSITLSPISTNVARTVEIPNVTGTLLIANGIASMTPTLAGSIYGLSIGANDTAFVWEGDTADANQTHLAAPVSPSGSNIIRLPDQGGTVALISDIGAAVTRVTQAADLSTSSTTGVNSDLAFAPANNTNYIVRGFLMASSTATANGWGFGVAWPTSDALSGSCTFQMATSSTAHIWRNEAVDADFFVPAPTSPTPTGELYVNFVDCSFEVTTTTSGNFQITFGGEIGTQTYVLGEGSYIEIQTY